MKRIGFVAAVWAIAAGSGAAAQTLTFEPQPNWWSSGQACVESRRLAGRNEEASAPRACRAAPAAKPAQAAAPASEPEAAAASSPFAIVARKPRTASPNAAD